MTEQLKQQPQDPPEDEPRVTGRRDALKAAGALAAGLIGGAVLSGTPTADAANTDPIVIGSTANTGTSPTGLTATGDLGLASVFDATAPGLTFLGLSGSAAGAGVLGDGGTWGGLFSGGYAAMSLAPQPDSTSLSDPFAAQGDILIDPNGVMYLCIVDGDGNTAPGVWTRLSHSGTNYLPSPVKLIDTRESGGGGKFAANETRNYTVAGVLGVPAQAVGVFGNISVLTTAASGSGGVFPAGGSRNGTSNVVWAGKNARVATLFNSRVGTSRRISIQLSTIADLHIDIIGYVL